MRCLQVPFLSGGGLGLSRHQEAANVQRLIKACHTLRGANLGMDGLQQLLVEVTLFEVAHAKAQHIPGGNGGVAHFLQSDNLKADVGQDDCHNANG